MSFDSDDSASLSGSESDLEFDDIFGESSDEDDEFEGFLNRNITTEIQWSQTADNNHKHFTEFNPANVGPTWDNMGKKLYDFWLISWWGSTPEDEEVDESKCHQERQQKTPWTPIETLSELCAFAALLTLMNDLVEKPPYEDYFKRNEQMWFHMPGFEKVFSKKPFNELKRYIYFSNPDAQSPCKKGWQFW